MGGGYVEISTTSTLDAAVVEAAAPPPLEELFAVLTGGGPPSAELTSTPPSDLRLGALLSLLLFVDWPVGACSGALFVGVAGVDTTAWAGAGDVRAEPGVVLFAAGFVAAAAGVCGDDGTVFAELLRDVLLVL